MAPTQAVINAVGIIEQDMVNTIKRKREEITYYLTSNRPDVAKRLAGGDEGKIVLSVNRPSRMRFTTVQGAVDIIKTRTYDRVSAIDHWTYWNYDLDADDHGMRFTVSTEGWCEVGPEQIIDKARNAQAAMDKARNHDINVAQRFEELREAMESAVKAGWQEVVKARYESSDKQYRSKLTGLVNQMNRDMTHTHPGSADDDLRWTEDTFSQAARFIPEAADALHAIHKWKSARMERSRAWVTAHAEADRADEFEEQWTERTEPEVGTAAWLDEITAMVRRYRPVAA